MGTASCGSRLRVSPAVRPGCRQGENSARREAAPGPADPGCPRRLRPWGAHSPCFGERRGEAPAGSPRRRRAAKEERGRSGPRSAGLGRIRRPPPLETGSGRPRAAASGRIAALPTSAFEVAAEQAGAERGVETPPESSAHPRTPGSAGNAGEVKAAVSP